jgi:hypothetical protein
MPLGVKENIPLQLISYYHIRTLILLEKCYGTLPMHVLATTIRSTGYTSLLSEK